MSQTETTPRLVTERDEDGIRILELNNPPANTYSYDMMRQLDEAILRARFDAAVHVILLRGSGDKFFCAGADIAMLQEADPYFKYNFCLHANETLNRLEQTNKLVIAALNGHCVGGGLEVALAADLRVGKAGGGKVGLPEVHLGVLPGTGGTQRLSRALGKSRSIEMMVTGRNLSMEQAHELGLVNHLLAADGFDAAALDYAKQFLPPAKASKAVGLIKRSVQSGLEMSFNDGLALERELQQHLFVSDDAAEGIRAYNEKRKPSFEGR